MERYCHPYCSECDYGCCVISLVYWVSGAVIVIACSSLLGLEIALPLVPVVAVCFLLFVLVNKGGGSSLLVDDEDEYFAAKHDMAAVDTHRSLEASWMMLGNVFLANMFLAQQFGAWSAWVLITWAIAFLAFEKHLSRIREVPATTDSLHSFLFRAYQSSEMRRVAALVTFVTGVGIFAIELAVAVAFVSPFFGENGKPYAILMVGLCVVGMIVGILMGGLKAVIRADAFLFPIIVAGALLIVVVGLYLPFEWSGSYARTESVASLYEKAITGIGDATKAHDWNAIAVFAIGVLFLQVPLLIADYGTWQRVRATRLDESAPFGEKVKEMARSQAVLWGIPVLLGAIFLARPSTNSSIDPSLYLVAGPLIDLVEEIIHLSVPTPVLVVLAFVVTLGLMAVMASTANSYLMIALETWVKDINPRSPGDHSNLSRARSLAVFFGLIGCIPALVMLHYPQDFNLISLVLTFFGSQVALVPSVLLALYSKKTLSGQRLIIWTTLGGYFLALAYGLIVTYVDIGSEAWQWLRKYGAFFVPCIAFATALAGVALSGNSVINVLRLAFSFRLFRRSE